SFRSAAGYSGRDSTRARECSGPPADVSRAVGDADRILVIVIAAVPDGGLSADSDAILGADGESDSACERNIASSRDDSATRASVTGAATTTRPPNPGVPGVTRPADADAAAGCGADDPDAATHGRDAADRRRDDTDATSTTDADCASAHRAADADR